MSKRIVLSTFGSFGDVHPYVALARELKARGHMPVVATSEMYREKMDAAGVELFPVRPDDLPSYDEPERMSAMLETHATPVFSATTGPTNGSGCVMSRSAPRTAAVVSS